MTTRRTFLRSTLRAGAATAVAAATGVPWRTVTAMPRVLHLPSWSPVDEPEIAAIVRAALDTATREGAKYADVRVTRTRRELYKTDPADTSSTGALQTVEQHELAIGIRALVDGGWGFASLSTWSPEDVPWTVRTAVQAARANAWPGRPRVQLTPPATPATGIWRTPIRRDPFTVTREEKLAFLRTVETRLLELATSGSGGATLQLGFSRQERTFVSTEGASTTQTIYTLADPLAGPSRFRVMVTAPKGTDPGIIDAPFLTPSSVGYEVFEDAHVLDQLPTLYERALAASAALTAAEWLPSGGRFDVVFDGAAMAALVNGTLGDALTVDRALGDHGDGEPSYLSPLTQLLGTRPFSPHVTLAANRSQPGGAATVGWDEDGVAPRDVTLVRDGAVVDYLTDREYAPAVSDWHTRQRSPVTSAGCAAAASAAHCPAIAVPNLVLQPGAAPARFDDLIAGMETGFAICGGTVSFAENKSTGLGSRAMVYRVKQGKLAGAVKGTAYLFRSRELWQNLVTLGGPETVVTQGFAGETDAESQTLHSVTAPAAHIKNVHILDIRAQ